MLNLSEYLVQNEKKHLIKVSIRLIIVATLLVSVWASSWIEEKILNTIPAKIPWSLFLISVLVLINLYSYIRYTYKQNNLKIILKNYDLNEGYGYLIHKKTGKKICTNCLYSKTIEVSLQKKQNSLPSCFIVEFLARQNPQLQPAETMADFHPHQRRSRTFDPSG